MCVIAAGGYPFETEVGTMAAALAVWLITIASFTILPHRVRRMFGRLAMTGSLLLYPTAAGAAFNLLSCESVQLNSIAVSTLDGGDGYVKASARALIWLPLLNSYVARERLLVLYRNFPT